MTIGSWHAPENRGMFRAMRTETVLRKTLHHPIIYGLVAIVAFFAAGGTGPAVGAAIATWFVTALIP